ncbi:hypothetical protein CEXT_416141 [Caerostris extrusa]|uniref:Uncharacterized protein n=1 Tax=Caerostris extrusa TaxID=172846 RepID=A0AAV4N1H6_CAEEX|nr:hypothetical protein CEXT_416141 [Caerostris extrusa]
MNRIPERSTLRHDPRGGDVLPSAETGTHPKAPPGGNHVNSPHTVHRSPFPLQVHFFPGILSSSFCKRVYERIIYVKVSRKTPRSSSE